MALVVLLGWAGGSVLLALSLGRWMSAAKGPRLSDRTPTEALPERCAS